MTGSPDLEQLIRSKADSRDQIKTTLATSDRIIARVTDGIYREPWAAFRELVANAYDADASSVVIETGCPEFERMTVRDDGMGMSPKALAYVLKNIGGSSKRTAVGMELKTVSQHSPDMSPGGRQLIGKIGIGLFAVAQLTQHFQIITKAAGETYRLSATVQLQTHDEERLQRGEKEYVAGNVSIVSEAVPEAERGSHGTSVVLYQLRDDIRKTLQSTRLWDAALTETSVGEFVRKPPTFHIGYSMGSEYHEPRLPWKDTDSPEQKFERFFEASSNASGRGVKSPNLEHFDEYLRLIWKLSLSLPLTYINDHPFELDGSTGLLFLGIPDGTGQAETVNLDATQSIRQKLRLRASIDHPCMPFAVTLDGISLHRPISLPPVLRKSSRIGSPVMVAARQDNPFSDEDIERAGGRLSFEAYLYWNSKILPKETAGVLIRIRGASGTLFDSTFMNYLVSEQTRLRQITAEVFVHEGLDSAVNIDRESYNYSHPHFLFIQRWLHRALRLLVNRLKAVAAADLVRVKEKQRNFALQYADDVWVRRMGNDADPPFVDRSPKSLPDEVSGAEIDWTSGHPLPDRGVLADTGRIRALAAILEAYGILSHLPVEDRAKLLADILGIPETNL